jgi:hypothetical protein
MSKFKKEEEYSEEISKKRFPEYSNQELREFEKEVEKYRVEKEDKKGKYTYIDFWKYLQDQGAISKDNAIQITGFKYVKCHEHKDCEKIECDLPIYEILNDKWRQLCKLRGRTEYAKAQDLKSLDGIADKFKI